MVAFAGDISYALQNTLWPHHWVGAEALSGPQTGIPALGHIV